MTLLHGQQDKERRGRTSAKEKHEATGSIFSELQPEVFGHLLVPAHLKEDKEPLNLVPNYFLEEGHGSFWTQQVKNTWFVVLQGQPCPFEPVPECVHSSSDSARQQLQAWVTRSPLQGLHQGLT